MKYYFLFHLYIMAKLSHLLCGSLLLAFDNQKFSYKFFFFLPVN